MNSQNPFPCCVLLALSWSTNKNPSTDKLRKAINQEPCWVISPALGRAIESWNKIADIVLLSHNRLQLTVKTSYLETNLHSGAFIICCLYFSLDLHFSKVFELAFVFSLVFALVFVFILGSLYVLVFVFLVGLCIGVCICRGSLYWCLYQLSL